MERLYFDGKPLLVVFHENGAEADLRLLRTAVRVLLGALDVMANRIPDGAHGPLRGLPGTYLRVRERAALRVDCWDPTAQRRRRPRAPDLLPVMARRLYPGPASCATTR